MNLDTCKNQSNDISYMLRRIIFNSNYTIFNKMKDYFLHHIFMLEITIILHWWEWGIKLYLEKINIQEHSAQNRKSNHLYWQEIHITRRLQCP